MVPPENAQVGLRGKNWHDTYRTSAPMTEGRAVDILHDFYVPALSLSTNYDRVAGYFNSSSLAAASQGFSAFVGKQGKMRLIVGADLAPRDVEAILRGDQGKYARELERELGSPEQWPEDVKNGVELLGWMVAQSYLDVRVAFRVHGRTGKPLPVGSVEDGYVHEKWAVFEDEYANRLLASGSLNESRRALTRNAENLRVDCDWWDERARRQVEDHERDFENLWHNKHPHFQVMTLPEAVRQSLLKMAEEVELPTEIDGTSAAPREVEPPSALERLKFAIIRDAPKLPGGKFVGMETAPVEPWPHQSVVARRLIETWPYSYLLCDEVGLGKTIEAGLAIRSLYLSGLVDRVLIAPPASLKNQWQREMASKFLLAFARTETSPSFKHHYIHPFEDSRDGTSLYGPSLNIVSRNMLERRDRRRDVEAAEPFDIALVDEAHAARRQNPSQLGEKQHPEYGNLYETLRDHLRQKTQALWLATATPMQLEKIEAWDLLRLTHRVGPFQYDPGLTFQYYDMLGQLVRGEALDEQGWTFLRRAVQSARRHDPVLWGFIKDAVIDARMRAAADRWLERDVTPRGPDQRHMRKLIFAAAPLSRVMLRHTRRLLEIYRDRGKLSQKLATRKVPAVPKIEFSKSERDAYDSLEDYCDELARQINRCSDGETKHNLGFYKSFLRLRFASSFYAISETVRRRKAKVQTTLDILEEIKELDRLEMEEAVMEPEEEQPLKAEEAGLKGRTEEDLRWELERLEELSDTLGRLHGPSRKMGRLLKALDRRSDHETGRIEQTVVFTRFLDTLTEIVRRLREADSGILIGTYSGDGGQYTDPRTNALARMPREEVKGRFLRGEIDVLVCTDAAAEGLNLQTANMVINYDLPWNPMKVEQRIGRLDRIGQKHDQVSVLNLCYLGSSEEIVYGRLLRRLREAGKVVGTQQLSMLPVTSEEFRQLAEGELAEEELKQRASHRADEQRERTRSMEVPPEDRYETYMRLERERAGSGPPVDLAGIWSAVTQSRYLRDLGCLVADANGEEVLDVRGVQGVPEKTKLTISRALYEEGLPEGERRAHFASYGDEYFDALLDHVGQFELPPCVRRLSVQMDDLGTEVVGYAVACEVGPDRQEIRLVRNLAGLRGLDVVEGRELTDEEVADLRDQLQRVARDEFGTARATERVEQLNRKAGLGQIILAHMVATSLISFRSKTGSNGEKFWDVHKDLEQLLAEGREISIRGLDGEKLRRVEDELIFEPKIPTVGSEATILAPVTLLQCAVDAACREADALKEKKSELLTNSVLGRLDNQLSRELKELKGL